MTKQETYDYLRNKGIEFEITEHEAVFNMDELTSVPLPYPECDAKNLFVRDDKKRNYYLITVKGNKKVNLKAFQETFGTRRLSFASAEDLKKMMDVLPGSVCPLGLLSDEERKIVFYFDKDFMDGRGLAGIHPNDNTATVWLKATDLVNLIEEHGNTVNIIEIAEKTVS